MVTDTAYHRAWRLIADRRALKPTLKVGDKVRLNDIGISQCFGGGAALQGLKEIVHTITHVEDESMTYPEPSFPVEVADPHLNQLMLDDYCFDKVAE